MSRRTFGSFVEHLGRCVYGGIYEPEHPSADSDGFRTDVLDLVRELGPTMVRYPGGNFVSGYRWEDGVGPRHLRPVRRDLSWHSIEPNTVGTDEFMRWCAKAGVEPMMAVNLGTRGVQEAVDLLEYVNHPSGTALSDQRVANGSPEPYGVRMWCLGNEMDGPWQIGHKTAHEYGRLAAETARAMRMADSQLELVACGSSGLGMPTFGAWEADVLTECYDQVDYVSVHTYYQEHDGDLGSFLASTTDMDRFIDLVVATADHVGAKLASRKRIQLSFDEWNVWYMGQPLAPGAEPPDKPWEIAPRKLEDHYHLADAVVVGSMLICLLRHSDRVTAACQAQLVNVIAPIFTEPGGPAWKQTIFHPFAQASALARGNVLKIVPGCPTYDTARYGQAPLIDLVATHDPESGDVAVFVVNRSVDGPVRLTLDLRALGEGVRLGECTVLADPDVYARNSADEPDRVCPRPLNDVSVSDGRADIVLPPVSWSTLTFRTHPE